MKVFRLARYELQQFWRAVRELMQIESERRRTPAVSWRDRFRGFSGVRVLWLLSVGLVPVHAGPKLVWDPNAELNVAGYKLIYGNASQVYSQTNVVMGRLNNSFTLQLPEGIWYIVATAFTDTGLESGFSHEVIWTNGVVPVPAPPVLPVVPAAPKNLRLTATIQGSASIFGPWTDMAWVQTGGSASNVYRTVLVKEEIIP